MTKKINTGKRLNTETPEKKKASKRVAKKKNPSKSKAAVAAQKNQQKKKEVTGEKKETPHSISRSMLLDRKYTDEQILEAIQKQCPDKPFKKGQISCNRWDLNNKDMVKPPIEKLVEVDGKLVPKSQLPVKTKKKKYTEENDPLNKIAGIKTKKMAKKVRKLKKKSSR